MASPKDQKEHQHEIIIIKRHDDEEHEHHSSAWKVAHADFMTAMMAFFLIMWLINVTDEEVRKGISQYFNPVHITEGEAENKGLNDPSTEEEKDAEKKKPGKAPPTDAHAAGGEATAAAPPEAGPDPHATETAGAEAAEEAHAETAGGAPEAMPGDPLSLVLAEGDPVTAGPAEKAMMDDRERAAFQDPYALLAALAADYEAKHPATADVVVGDTRNPGLIGGEADRDPFDPIYWQMAEAPDVRTTQPGDPATNEAVSPVAQMDAAAPEPAMRTETAEPIEPAPATIVASPAPPAQPAESVAAKADAGAEAETMAEAADLGNALRSALEEALGASPSPEINVTATSEGVLIDLIDDEDFTMFEIGSAIPDPKVVVILGQVASVLAGKPGTIVVRGHTDGRPFRSDTYDNWRLSAARAHMAYYMLVRGGLEEGRVERIEGYADRHLKIPSDPNAATNRRIEILVREATP